MHRLNFVLIGEGSFDHGLLRPLETLCRRYAGEPMEVSGEIAQLGPLRKVGHAVADKLRATLQLHPTADLIFIHRDADGIDPAPRYAEIADAVKGAPLTAPHVAIVPVQETEAWLLLDEAAIRHVAGRPQGKEPLHLPAPRLVEQMARPKERLEAALRQASGLTGRRRAQFERDLPQKKRQLLDWLDPDGPIRELPAWQRLEADIQAAIDTLKERAEP